MFMLPLNVYFLTGPVPVGSIPDHRPSLHPPQLAAGDRTIRAKVQGQCSTETEVAFEDSPSSRVP